jgi:hypothetical protein
MGFFDTLKRGAKQLGKDAKAKAKEAAKAPPPAAKPGEQLTVAYRPDKEDWVVRRPSGSVKRKAETKSAATSLARQIVATSQKYNQVQVLKKDAGGLDDIVASREEFRQPRSRSSGGGQDDAGPMLPGFEGGGGDSNSDPYVPDLGGGGGQQSGSDEQPYVPETLFDK